MGTWQLVLQFFPTGIGMAATWSPELVKEVGQVIAKEIRSQGGILVTVPYLI